MCAHLPPGTALSSPSWTARQVYLAASWFLRFLDSWQKKPGSASLRQLNQVEKPLIQPLQANRTPSQSCFNHFILSPIVLMPSRIVPIVQDPSWYSWLSQLLCPGFPSLLCGQSCFSPWSSCWELTARYVRFYFQSPNIPWPFPTSMTQCVSFLFTRTVCGNSGICYSHRGLAPDLLQQTLSQGVLYRHHMYSRLPLQSFPRYGGR